MGSPKKQLPTALKRPISKEISEGQDESGMADTQEEDLGNFFEHLDDLQYFSTYDNHLEITSQILMKNW